MVQTEGRTKLYLISKDDMFLGDGPLTFHGCQQERLLAKLLHVEQVADEQLQERERGFGRTKNIFDQIFRVF